jgi:hypothetical protein
VGACVERHERRVQLAQVAQRTLCGLEPFDLLGARTECRRLVNRRHATALVRRQRRSGRQQAAHDRERLRPAPGSSRALLGYERTEFGSAIHRAVPVHHS